MFDLCRDGSRVGELRGHGSDNVRGRAWWGFLQWLSGLGLQADVGGAIAYGAHHISTIETLKPQYCCAR